jgi:hypothetical protein
MKQTGIRHLAKSVLTNIFIFIRLFLGLENKKAGNPNLRLDIPAYWLGPSIGPFTGLPFFLIQQITALSSLYNLVFYFSLDLYDN